MSHWKDVLRTVQLGGVAIAILGLGQVGYADTLDPLSVTGNVQAKAVTEGSGDKLVWTIQNTTNVILTLDNGLRTRGLGFNYTGGDRDDAPAISSTTGCDAGVMLAAQTGACVLVIEFTSPAVPDTGNDENNDRGFWDLTATELGAPVLTGSGAGIGTVQSGAIVGRGIRLLLDAGIDVQKLVEQVPGEQPGEQKINADHHPDVEGGLR